MIKIYTNANCPYCKTVKEALNSNEIKFNEFLTSEYNEVWKEVVNLTNIAMVPTIEYKQEYLIPNRDYKNPEHLVQILKEMKESKEPYDRRTFERVKTLNYNMGMAFARLDKTLKELENKIK